MSPRKKRQNKVTRRDPCPDVVELDGDVVVGCDLGVGHRRPHHASVLVSRTEHDTDGTHVRVHTTNCFEWERKS